MVPRRQGCRRRGLHRDFHSGGGLAAFQLLGLPDDYSILLIVLLALSAGAHLLLVGGGSRIFLTLRYGWQAHRKNSERNKIEENIIKAQETVGRLAHLRATTRATILPLSSHSQEILILLYGRPAIEKLLGLDAITIPGDWNDWHETEDEDDAAAADD